MTTLFDPMTSAPHSSSPTLDMLDKLDGALDPEKSHTLQEHKVSDPNQVTPEPETVTVTVSTVGEDQGSIVGQQNPQFADPNAIQFQYRTDASGQVQATAGYNNGQQIRVVHVQATDPTGERVEATPTSFSQTPHAQAVQTVIQHVQSPFSNGSSPTHPDADATADGNRFTYFQSQGDANASNVVQAGHSDTLDSAANYGVRSIPVSLTQPGSPSQIPIAMTESQTITTVGTPTGQFYVMMSPQDVMQPGTQRNIAPRTHPMGTKLDGPRTARDERRRTTHNEVERRRRDKINNWITKLSKVVPDCEQDHSKAGQVGGTQKPSKGGILSKTVEYINELKSSNARMAEAIKESERLAIDTELLRQQVEELRQENALLRAQLQQHGIELGAPGPQPT